MHFYVVSIFPEMVKAICQYGVLSRAIDDKLLRVTCYNPRDYSNQKHRCIDDRPYGGGPGMVMMAQPLLKAISAAKARCTENGHEARVVYLSPQGRVFTHEIAKKQAKNDALILLAGRYEGIDERVIDTVVDEQWSIGDYVLSGGELPAMVAIDAISRWIPGNLGNAQSASQDSFESGLLDCPHYTRPEVVEGMTVPKVLLSGNHDDIAQWREEQAIRRTYQYRPDLFAQLPVTEAVQKKVNTVPQLQSDEET